MFKKIAQRKYYPLYAFAIASGATIGLLIDKTQTLKKDLEETEFERGVQDALATGYSQDYYAVMSYLSENHTDVYLEVIDTVRHI